MHHNHNSPTPPTKDFCKSQSAFSNTLHQPVSVSQLSNQFCGNSAMQRRPKRNSVDITFKQDKAMSTAHSA